MGAGKGREGDEIRTAARAVRDLAADLRHMRADWDSSPGRVLLAALPALPLYPRLRAGVGYRLSTWCWDHRLRPVALWLQSRTIRSTGAEIHPAARLGPGFALIHTVGVVVGHEVVAGPNLVLYHGVTLGHTGRGEGQPRLGEGVRIGAGAAVLGPVRVGDGAWIGANAVVLGDVPAGRTVGGLWRGESKDD